MTSGQSLRFTRGYSVFERGNLVTVLARTNPAVSVESAAGRTHHLSLKYSNRGEILDRQKLPIGIGSVLQLRADGVSLDGGKLVNGERVTVLNISDDGTLTVADRDGVKQLGREQRILQPGYAVTSYAAQGKTVDAVLLADAEVAAAAHKKEWYVSISRARRRIAVFTPDVVGLSKRESRPRAIECWVSN